MTCGAREYVSERDHEPTWRPPDGGVVVVGGPIFRIGQVLNDTFEIRGVLGRGGMGQVFDAYDRVLARRVAIKAAWPHVGERPIRAQAQALAALRHPSVCTVYGVGCYAGIDYVVMEYVAGTTLHDRMQARTGAGTRYTIEEAVLLLARIADALAAVHDAGLAHCDVKPSNIMLAACDRVVLTDFGAFRVEFGAVPERISGSPHYMAPEQAADSIEPGSAFLVDVYALGVIAYMLLAGEAPFATANPDEVLRGGVAGAVAPLSDRRPDVPKALARLVEELLASDPRDRPQEMHGIAARLRGAGEPPRAAPGCVIGRLSGM